MNKTELFEFLTEVVATHDFTSAKEVYITSGKTPENSVLSIMFEVFLISYYF